MYNVNLTADLLRQLKEGRKEGRKGRYAERVLRNA
jgi:hypothetical protein